MSVVAPGPRRREAPIRLLRILNSCLDAYCTFSSVAYERECTPPGEAG
jgi:hypothetical protein